MQSLALYFDAPVPYDAGVRLQEALVAARQQDRIPDTVLFLEHRPVVTLGRRARQNHLVAPAAELQRRGIDLAVASRGGDITYHGPGQLVMYPILRLGTAEADAHGYLHNLEEIALRTAAAFGVAARRRAGMNGAWTDAGKLAAIGFHLRRWVTMHGMSFNVEVDLAGFDLIVGCGLVGEKVCSLRTLLGPRTPSLAAVRETMTRIFAEVCGRPLAVHAVRDGWPAELSGLGLPDLEPA